MTFPLEKIRFISLHEHILNRMFTKVFYIMIALLVIILTFMFFGIRKKTLEIPKFGNEKELNAIKTERVGKLNVTTIYDNYKVDDDFEKGWGFSCLVKAENKSILFDTGADSETLLKNMEKLEIDPKDLDIIFLSHIHHDHTGGLEGVLKQNSDLDVFIPSSFPSSFRKKVRNFQAEPIDVKEPKEIIKGIYSTGELGTLTKEQSLLVKSERGLVIITGCAHPGIVNIVERGKEVMDEKVYLVMGGFHLSSATDRRIKGIINSFRDLGVKKAAPCHCSGDRTRELFKQEYGENYIENGVGKKISIG